MTCFNPNYRLQFVYPGSVVLLVLCMIVFLLDYGCSKKTNQTNIMTPSDLATGYSNRIAQPDIRTSNDTQVGLCEFKPVSRFPAVSIYALAFSQDNTYLAWVNSISEDNNTISVVNVCSNKIVTTIDTEVPMYCLCFSQDSKILFCGCTHHSIRAYETETGKDLYRFSDNQLSANRLCLSSCGNYLYSGGISREVIVWDIKKRQIHGVVAKHSNAVWGLCASTDNKHIAAISANAFFGIWELNTGKNNVMVYAHEHPRTMRTGIQGVVFDSGSNLFWTGGTDGCVRAWDPERPEFTDSFDARVGEIECLAFDATRRLLVVGGWGRKTPGQVALFNIRDGSEYCRLECFPKRINEVAVSKDGEYLAVGNSGSRKGEVTLWRIDDLQPKNDK